MSQPLITKFYNKRKRAAEGLAGDFKSKVLVLDGKEKLFRSEHTLNFEPKYSESHKDSEFMKKEDGLKVVSLQTPSNTRIVHMGDVNSSDRPVKKTKETLTKNATRTKVKACTNESDIRHAFKAKALNSIINKSEKMLEASESGNNCKTGKTVDPDPKITFQLLGSLSPMKKESEVHKTPIKTDNRNKIDTNVRNARRELGLMSPKKAAEDKSKIASLEEIKNKLSRSARLEEIRRSIKKFNNNDKILKDIDIKRKKLENSSPQLKKFSSLDLEVPVSPQKACVSVGASSCKSPLKSPLTSPSKAPAFERLAHLAEFGVPTLPLPYSYRMLAEIFRCVDTVTSMMYNRKETITFDKLKSAVQQMLRRNFTEQHVGQIKTVLPNAFKFSQEKNATFGSSKKNKYQLVIIPIIGSEKGDTQRIKDGSSHSIMTPSLLVERRERFHHNLLEIVKDHHEEFLKKLDCPIEAPRDKLLRWYPSFDLERVPPVIVAELPSAPVEEKVCSAQDVLDRAKTLFGCNQRMEKALQMVSEQMNKSEELIAARISNKSNTSNSSLLKGIPKALLEKVRAKQAAKALLAMTRTPDEDRESTQLLRLPEIARVLRNIFVAEKKNVLLLEVALEKLSNSYREALSPGELEQHIRLLMKVVPGWVDILHVRKADYVKVAKDADLSLVLKKLDKLAAEKNANL